MKMFLLLFMTTFSTLAMAEEQALTYSPLSDEDKLILANGEMGTGRYVSGGAVGSVMGLGIGHAIQGRYSEKGWIFTTGELVTGMVAASGFFKCMFGSMLGAEKNSSCNDDAAAIGFMGLVTFRVWEIYDLWATPYQRNKRYRELKMQVTFVPLPNGATAGLVYRF